MDGTVSNLLIRYYREQARGGTRLIIVEYAYVDKIVSKSAHYLNSLRFMVPTVPRTEHGL